MKVTVCPARVLEVHEMMDSGVWENYHELAKLFGMIKKSRKMGKNDIFFIFIVKKN